MLYFPQISTGSLAQFPIRKQQVFPSFVNDVADGRQLRASDPDGSLVRWELKYVNLCDAEKRGIEDLFAATQGRLRTFVFVDPTANLLASSDVLTSAQWIRAAGITSAAGIDDPFGGTKAWRIHNGSAAAAAISQPVSCPPALRYCFSVYVRSTDVVNCRLEVRNAADHVAITARAIPQWTRPFCSALLPDVDGPVTFGVELPAGTSVDVFGLQVDAQPSPSAYRPSVLGGLYPNTRFDEDILRVRTDGMNNHALTIRLISRTT